jgi:valyl-tRNA synthetase
VGDTLASLGAPVATELEGEDYWILSRLARTAGEAAE